MVKQIVPVIKKELAYFFHSPTAYISVGVFVIVINWFYFANFFLIGQASMRDFFRSIPLVYLFFVPVLSMASFAEEKRTKTIEILFTLPLTNLSIVLGKFLSGLLVLILALLLTGTIPVTLFFLGNPEVGPIVTGYMAAILLGASSLSVGLFLSVLSENQIVSFTLTSVVSLLFYITGTGFFLERMPATLLNVFRFVSVLTHFSSLAKGLIDVRDLVYFISLMGVFLYLTVKKVGER